MTNQAQRLAQAFNAICKSAELEHVTFTTLQAQIVFDQLALACSDLQGTFNHSEFADACETGFVLVNDD